MKNQKDPKNTFCLRSKILTVTPMTDEEMSAICASETDPHLKAAYAEMLALSSRDPQQRLWYVCWRIALPDGTAVGSLCFKGVPDEHKSAEIGYGIFPQYENKGYATEAVSLACEWAFETGICAYVTAQTDQDNAASRRVLEKNGFVLADGSGCVNGSPVSVPEREDGCLLWEKARPNTSWLSVYLCLGISCGLCFGIAFGNQLLGLLIGLGCGLAIGAGLDARDRESRKK